MPARTVKGVDGVSLDVAENEILRETSGGSQQPGHAPSVESPLGDFFAHRVGQFAS